MSKLVCGDLEYENTKYKFDFRDNLLVLIPEKMDTNYTKWYFEHLGKNEKFDYINLDGITSDGKYICFIHVKFSHLGRGALQAFVPGYIIGKTNSISPLPICENIEKVRFYGDCLDKFYYPKRIVESNDFLNSKKIKFEISNKKLKTDDFTIDGDKYSFGVYWTAPYSSNINVVLDVSSYLEINFKNTKNINQIVDYYFDVKKFFSFINNRKYIKFSKIILFKTENINFGFSDTNDIKSREMEFDLFFVDPDEEFDLNMSINTLRLEDLDNKFTKVYNEIKSEKFLITYYPLSTKDDHYIDNDKYVGVSSAFESEFDKLNPNFKSSINKEYDDVKKTILKAISNKKYITNKKLQILESQDKKTLKSVIKECDYFSKIISKIDGTLQEKIIYSYKKYNKIIEEKKQILLKNYDIEKAKDGILAEKFVKRRNDISHGNGTKQFEPLEIVSYELLRICIYCITLERCKFSEEKMKIFIDKIF